MSSAGFPLLSFSHSACGHPVPSNYCKKLPPTSRSAAYLHVGQRDRVVGSQHFCARCEEKQVHLLGQGLGGRKFRFRHEFPTLRQHMTLVQREEQDKRRGISIPLESSGSFRDVGRLSVGLVARPTKVHIKIGIPQSTGCDARPLQSCKETNRPVSGTLRWKADRRSRRRLLRPLPAHPVASTGGNIKVNRLKIVKIPLAGV